MQRQPHQHGVQMRTNLPVQKKSLEWKSITKVSYTDVLDVHDQMPLLREDSLPKSLLVQWNKLCEPLVLTRG